MQVVCLNGKVAVLGPPGFIDWLDWNRVIETTRLFVAYQPDIDKAIQVAIQTLYAEWRGLELTRAEETRAQTLRGL